MRMKKLFAVCCLLFAVCCLVMDLVCPVSGMLYCEIVVFAVGLLCHSLFAALDHYWPSSWTLCRDFSARSVVAVAQGPELLQSVPPDLLFQALTLASRLKR